MRKLLHALVFVALGSWVTLTSVQSNLFVNAGGPSIPAQILRWGVLLQTDEACYQVGQTARVIHALYNYTEQDKMVFVNTFGPNGCSFRVEIRDEMGQIVWEPVAPFCSRIPSAPVTVAGCGGRTGSAFRAQLVYRNNQGVGIPGANLPPGFYNVIFTANFAGPHAGASTYGRGFAPTASVPIQILP